MQNTKTPRPEVSPAERVKNFEPVDLGYDRDLAIKEAERCIQCKNPTCIDQCPVEVDIPAFIKKIQEDDVDAALDLLLEKNLFPSMCGRVCPQETQCEQTCIIGKKEGREPVAIGRLERYAGDFGKANPFVKQPETGHRIAVIGSGPAGLACAGELAKLGHKVVLFESLHVAGGVLVYGIPEFRLPNEVVRRELKGLEDLGVEINVDFVAGRVFTAEDLLGAEFGFDAVFVGVGAGLPMFMGIEGENTPGVFSANEFLTRVNLMSANYDDFDTPVRRGKNVIVVGGGNVAMDAARTALRLGAETVTLAYRRTEAEMPAREEEIEHAHEEGIIFRTLCAPIAVHEDEDGFCAKVTLQNMELGELDASGRPRPVPIEGDTVEVDCDVLIIAVGTKANATLDLIVPEAEKTKRGYLSCDEAGRSSIEGVFGGGDITTGAATVIEAMGAGRKAAFEITRWLAN